MNAMITLLWAAITISAAHDREEDEGPGLSFMPVEPTKWERFCSRHPFVDKIWPYVFSIALWGTVFGLAAMGYPLFEYVMGWMGK